MAPSGNPSGQTRTENDPESRCKVCGALRCHITEHFDVYCLCEDGRLAQGTPPSCKASAASSGADTARLQIPGGGSDIPLSPDMFVHNEQSGKSGQKSGFNPESHFDRSQEAKHNMQSQDLNLKGPCDTNTVCKDKNCGEAGCVCNPQTQEPMCYCPDTELPPDENYHCPRVTGKPINSSQKIEIPGGIVFPLPYRPPPKEPHNNANGTSSSMSTAGPATASTGSQGPLSSSHIRLLLQIFVPTLLVLLVLAVIVIVALIWRRRRRLTHKRRDRKRGLGGTSGSSGVVSWIQKQDQEHLLENMTVVGKNPIYLGLDTSCTHVQLKGLQTTYIPQEDLTLMEVIGEGAFGKVYKGTVKWDEDNTSEVAVKILKEDASRETREDFVHEVKIMCSFTHPNILRLIGVVTKDTYTPYMVFEYMEYGDLTELLRCNDPFSAKGPKLEIKQNELVDIATQIANGMVYLASKHFVHRDLATRNCLVGSELVVKISDFGMSRDIYTCDYYKIGGSRMLPIRWMSAESIKYGRFTCDSDVWSFGVVLWEIFSFGKQPYYGHTNEEVIRLIDDGILLQRPNNCPDTVYHVMLGCWRKNPKDRFTFSRIHKHLKDYNKTLVICYQPSPIVSSSSDMTTGQEV